MPSAKISSFLFSFDYRSANANGLIYRIKGATTPIELSRIDL
jgi:hypothetical protein